MCVCVGVSLARGQHQHKVTQPCGLTRTLVRAKGARPSTLELGSGSVTMTGMTMTMITTTNKDDNGRVTQVGPSTFSRAP